MNAILLIVTTVSLFCALKHKLSLIALLHFCKEMKQYAMPTDEELHECSLYAIKKLLHLVK